eukprot:3768766-Rhodomonas_salina.4
MELWSGGVCCVSVLLHTRSVPAYVSSFGSYGGDADGYRDNADTTFSSMVRAVAGVCVCTAYNAGMHHTPTLCHASRQHCCLAVSTILPLTHMHTRFL